MTTIAKVANHFGNLNSGLMSLCKNPVPVVGMGATILHGRDRDAGTVVAVSYNKKGVVNRAVVQWDRAERIDTNGMSECQTYRFERDTTQPMDRLHSPQQRSLGRGRAQRLESAGRALRAPRKILRLQLLRKRLPRRKPGAAKGEIKCPT